MFENIKRVEFDERQQVVAMVSSEGERVPLVTLVDPSSTGMQVERWLQLVEGAMKGTIANQIELAHAAFQMKPRTKWTVEWPGAIAIVVTQIMWTTNVEAALRSGEPKALRGFERTYSAEFDEFCELARAPLTELQRVTFGSILLLDRRCRDVLSELADKGCDSASSFDWLAQLRYYFEGASASVTVRMLTHEVKYGNEFLGSTGRLVVTPLTDRCYRTLMAALQLYMVGAPQGPAGTGKTETIKDLAKCVAMQCVVFNCSDGLE